MVGVENGRETSESVGVTGDGSGTIEKEEWIIHTGIVEGKKLGKTAG